MAILAPAVHGLCGLNKSFSFHGYSSCGHGGGCRHYSLDYSEVTTKAGISNPLDYHVLPFPHPPPRCQNMASGRTRSVREGGGGRIPTHFLHLEARIEAILLMTYC